MKFSELTTENGLDVLCEITPYLGNIITDEELSNEIRRKTKLGASATRLEVYAAAIDKLTKLLPIILKTHRDDVYGIIAAVNNKPVADVRKQPLIKTAIDIRDIVRDKDFADFFKSLRDMESN